MEPIDSLPLVWFSSFALAFSGAMMPGPMLAVTIKEAAKRGFWAGPLVTAGHALLELALVLALFAGLGSLFQEKLFLGIVGVVGGSALLWMAVGMFRELPKLRLSFDTEGIEGSNPVVAGVMTSITNPYFTLWWATAGLSALTLSAGSGWMSPAAFFTGHISGDLVWYSLISALVHFGRRFLTNKRYRILVGTMAAILFIFAFLFMGNGIINFTSIT